LAETRSELRPVPFYATVGGSWRAWPDQRHLMTMRQTDGARAAAARLEVRSYEAEYINGLWHMQCGLSEQGRAIA